MLLTMATPIDTSSHTNLIPDGGRTFYNNIPPRHQLQRNRKLSIIMKFIQLVRKTVPTHYNTDTSSPVSDIDIYVIIWKLLDSIFNNFHYTPVGIVYMLTQEFYSVRLAAQDMAYPGS
jgi:hypothetical protein